MRYIPGNTGDIAGRERDGHCAAEFQGTAVGVADTHLQTIVEMEMLTSHIGEGVRENWKEGNNFCIQLSVLAFLLA